MQYTYWIVKKDFCTLTSGDIIQASLDIGVYAVKVIRCFNDIDLNKSYTFLSPQTLIKNCEQISANKLKDFLEIFDLI